MSNRLMWILAVTLCVLWLVPMGCGGETSPDRKDTVGGEGEGEGGEGEGEGEGGEGEGEGEGGEGEGEGEGGEGEGEGEGGEGEGEGEGGYKTMWKCITCAQK